MRLLDFDGSGDFEREELREALRSAEDLQLSEAELDDLLEQSGGVSQPPLHSVLSYDALHSVLTSGRYRRADDGRYFVLLSLAEAETVRAIMHMRQGKALVEGQDVSLALHCIPANGVIFDQSDDFPTAPRYQVRRALTSTSSRCPCGARLTTGCLLHTTATHSTPHATWSTPHPARI